MTDGLTHAAAKAGVVLLRAGGERYLLRLDHVRDVMSPGALTPVPHGPQLLLGLAHHRGRIVPVFDLAGLNGRPMAATADSLVVVCSAGPRTAGLAVDSVDDVAPRDTGHAAVPILDVFFLLDMPHARAA